MGFLNANLISRIISAFILIPMAIFVLWVGGVVAVLALTLVAIIAAWEWGNIVNKQAKYYGPKIILTFSSGIVSLLWGLSFVLLSYGQWFTDIVLVILILSLLFFITYKDPHKVYYISGLLTIALTSISLAYIRFADPIDDKSGFWLVLFLFCITWAMDIGAYFFGCFFKGPKLAPKISPNKTWSGFGGGLFTVFLLMLAFRFFWDVKNMRFEFYILISVMLAAFGHMGDLAESAFKRRFNVKDSSQIIPGHGGVLDRLDSLAVSSWLFALIICLSVYFLSASMTGLD